MIQILGQIYSLFTQVWIKTDNVRVNFASEDRFELSHVRAVAFLLLTFWLCIFLAKLVLKLISDFITLSLSINLCAAAATRSGTRRRSHHARHAASTAASAAATQETAHAAHLGQEFHAEERSANGKNHRSSLLDSLAQLFEELSLVVGIGRNSCLRSGLAARLGLNFSLGL